MILWPFFQCGNFFKTYGVLQVQCTSSIEKVLTVGNFSLLGSAHHKVPTFGSHIGKKSSHMRYSGSHIVTQVPTYGKVPTLRTPCGNFFFSTLRLKSFLKKNFLIQKSAMSKKFSKKSTTRKFQTWKMWRKFWEPVWSAHLTFSTTRWHRRPAKIAPNNLHPLKLLPLWSFLTSRSVSRSISKAKSMWEPGHQMWELLLFGSDT